MNIIAASLSFLLVLISVYFGASIHNANTNMHITHLNEMDNIFHYDVALVPKLTQQAAIYTLPLVVAVLVLAISIMYKSTVNQVKSIAIGVAIAMVFVLIFEVLVLTNPAVYDFSKWGYVWIVMGVFSVVGNALSIFIKGNSK